VPSDAMEVASFLKSLVEWAGLQPHVAALALVGSHARGAARQDSDIDLIVLVTSPLPYLEDATWVSVFGQPVRHEIEDWGKVTSIRVWYATGLEVEFGLTGLDWASDPADQGDAHVVRHGIKVLYDRDGRLSSRLAGFGSPLR
jgi:predicted nucleotidyltransferase